MIAKLIKDYRENGRFVVDYIAKCDQCGHLYECHYDMPDQPDIQGRPISADILITTDFCGVDCEVKSLN